MLQVSFFRESSRLVLYPGSFKPGRDSNSRDSLTTLGEILKIIFIKYITQPAWDSEDQSLLAIWSFILPCHLLALPLWLLHLFLSISHVFWSTLLSYLVAYPIFSCMFYLPCASLGVILRWCLGCGLSLIYPPCIASRFVCLLLEVNKGWHNNIVKFNIIYTL